MSKGRVGSTQPNYCSKLGSTVICTIKLKIVPNNSIVSIINQMYITWPTCQTLKKLKENKIKNQKSKLFFFFLTKGWQERNWKMTGNTKKKWRKKKDHSSENWICMEDLITWHAIEDRDHKDCWYPISHWSIY